MDRNYFENMQEKTRRTKNELESWHGRLRNKVERLIPNLNLSPFQQTRDTTTQTISPTVTLTLHAR